jgi:selenocysteine-specific elongation factor
VVEHAAEAVVAEVVKAHSAAPWRDGVALNELQLEGIGRDLAVAAVDRLVRRDRLHQRGGVLAVANHRAIRLAADEQLIDKLEQAMLAAGVSPPDEAEWPAVVQASSEAVFRAQQVLLDRGVLVTVGPGLVLHHAAVGRAVEVVRQLFAKAPAFETPEFRNALSVSRKYAVPLLDYLDSLRVTVRSGSRRTPGAACPR